MDRNEINVQDTWDLTPVFADVAAWEDARAKAEAALPDFAQMLPGMTASAQALYDITQMLVSLSSDIERVYTYAHLRYSEDTTNNEARQLMGKAQDLIVRFSEAATPYDTTLLTLTPDQLEGYLQTLPALEDEFGILLRERFRYKPHTLSEAEEQLLAAFTKVRSASEDTYETFT
ncbi:MAG: hypothetical protein IKI21_13140, partial [Oscillospiraceae bacterium]|nr:hypothetical protein [Oscillospiraceae bacterium]